MKLSKNLLFTVIISLCSLTLVAQFQSNDFNKSLFYKDINAKVIFKNGDVQDVNTFYHPLFMIDPNVPLGGWKPLANKEIDGVAKKDLKAIFIDGNLWVPRSTPLGEFWVVIKIQGAIEYFIYPNAPNGTIDVTEEKINRDVTTNYKPKDITIIMASAVKKLNMPAISQTQLMNFAKIMGDLTSDYKELSDKVIAKESGYKFLSMTSVIREYNEWYEKEHPGEVSKITSEDWGASGDPTGATLEEGIASLKNKRAEAKEKFESKKASRPTTVPAEIASKKPNIPVKKESFTDKLNRIKADGNKVGILFTNPHLYIKPPPDASSTVGSGMGGLSGGMMADKKTVGQHPKDTVLAFEELEKLGSSLVDELNKAFNTDVFELIEDESQVPYRKAMGSFLINDWWVTKYKMLITYSIDTYYDISKGSKGYTGYFRTNSSVTATEFFMSKDKPKQKIIVSTNSMGNYDKQLSESSDDAIKTIADIEQKMNGVVDEDMLLEALIKEREERLNKFITKRKK